MTRYQDSPRGVRAATRLMVKEILSEFGAVALPGDERFKGIRFLQDSTGIVRVAINSTGTTWKYLMTTSVAADAD